MTWPDTIAVVALAVIVVALVAALRGPALIRAWADSAYEDVDDEDSSSPWSPERPW